jgi:peptidoglycan hydrolase CwlO-like protein
MKTLIFLPLILVLSLLSISCAPSVAKTEYDKALNDLSAAQSQVKSLQAEVSSGQTQITSLQTDLSAAQSQVKSLQAEVSSGQTQITSLQTDLSAAQSQVKSLQADVSSGQSKIKSLQTDLSSAQDKAKQAALRMDILNSVFLPVLQGQQLTESQEFALFFEWRDKVNATTDSQLKSKFQAILDNTGNSAKLDTATMDFFAYLMESTASILK